MVKYVFDSIGINEPVDKQKYHKLYELKYDNNAKWKMKKIKNTEDD